MILPMSVRYIMRTDRRSADPCAITPVRQRKKTKFKVPSFTISKDTIGAKLKKWVT